MKKVLFILFSLALVFGLVGCNTSENGQQSDNKGEKLNVDVETSSEGGSLKDKSSEELDKIVEEKVKKANTPKSDYPFFKEIATKRADIQNLKEKGGVEIGRGNIYLHGMDESLQNFKKALNQEEKLYSFRKKGGGINTFFTERSFDEFKNSLEENGIQTEVVQQEGEVDIKQIRATVGGKEYFLTYKNNEQFSSSLLGKILDVNKAEVQIEKVEQDQ